MEQIPTFVAAYAPSFPRLKAMLRVPFIASLCKVKKEVVVNTPR